jgi:general secretion pathway protein D
MATGAWASEASHLYKQARKAEKAGQISRAYLLYSEAAALDPANHMYWQRAQALEIRAAIESKVMPHLGELADADAEAKLPVIAQATAEDLAEAQKPLPPTTLDALPLRKDFNLNGDAKTLFNTVSREYGLDCVFDGDYAAGKSARFRMDQVDYREALHALEAVTGSFIVPLSAKLFMVVKDTPQKRHEEEPFAAIIVPLPEPTTTQDLTAMITAVQQTCGIQKVAWDSQKNLVVMKDAVSKIIPARLLFEELLYPRAQVMFDMQLIEVSRSKIVNYGLTLPNTFPVTAFGNLLQNVPSLASGISGALLLSGGSTMIGLGIMDSMIVATLSTGDTENLLHASIRSVDGLPATIHVGTRFPVLTAGYFGPASFSGPGAYTPPPSFTYEDLGLSIKLTPHVQGLDEVEVAIESEFKLLTGGSVNGIPAISDRALKSEVSLKMGEWAVIAGLMNTSDARTITGIAGLSAVPLIGPLMRTTMRDKEDDEVLILLKPTLLTQPPDQVVTHVFRMGSETRPLTPL